MTRIVDVTTTIKVTFTDEQLDSALTSYRDGISKNATPEDLFRQVAYSLAMGSPFVEGIGEEPDDFTAEYIGSDTDVTEVDDE